MYQPRYKPSRPGALRLATNALDSGNDSISPIGDDDHREHGVRPRGAKRQDAEADARQKAAPRDRAQQRPVLHGVDQQHLEHDDDRRVDGEHQPDLRLAHVEVIAQIQRISRAELHEHHHRRERQRQERDERAIAQRRGGERGRGRAWPTGALEPTHAEEPQQHRARRCSVVSPSTTNSSLKLNFANRPPMTGPNEKPRFAASRCSAERPGAILGRRELGDGRGVGGAHRFVHDAEGEQRRGDRRPRVPERRRARTTAPPGTCRSFAAAAAPMRSHSGR